MIFVLSITDGMVMTYMPSESLCHMLILKLDQTDLRCPLQFPHENDRYSVHRCIQVFVGALKSCLRYICLPACSGVLHILCYVFVYLRSVCLMLPLCIAHFGLPLRYSLTFIVGLSQARTWISNVICHGSLICSVNEGVVGDCGRFSIFNFLFGIH